MNITVYLPDDIGHDAKLEGLNLSRMLREAVIAELRYRAENPPIDLDALMLDYLQKRDSEQNA